VLRLFDDDLDPALRGCAGWSVCIYNPDLDPDRRGADDIIRYLAQAITAAGSPR